jgi:hypothetical protein|uniref:Uncharacterized protein n=1 Tax=Eutreptiella gymnastica TaxID=73025 RepID=A0A7S4FYV7_9EUGL
MFQTLRDFLPRACGAVIRRTCPHRMLPTGSRKKTVCKACTCKTQSCTYKTNSVRKSGYQVFVHLLYHPVPPMHVIVRLLSGNQGTVFSANEWNNNIHKPLVSAIVCTNSKIEEIPVRRRGMVTTPKSTHRWMFRVPDPNNVPKRCPERPMCPLCSKFPSLHPEQYLKLFL